MLAAARRAGVGARQMAEIELLGEDLGDFRVNDFLFAEPAPLRFSLLHVGRSVARQAKILLGERQENRRNK